MQLLILDSAVDLVPREWLKDSNIKQSYMKKKRVPIINGSIHQHLLKDIPKEIRKDRPDILHFGLLTALGYEKLIPDLQVSFSISNQFYKIKPNTRIPRSQNRFYGILEQLLNNVNNNNLITRTAKPPEEEEIIVFSKFGSALDLDIFDNHNFFGFGGFAHGSIKNTFANQIEVKLSNESLDLWTAISNFLNLYHIHKLKK